MNNNSADEHNQTIRMHHLTMVVEPECKYLDHLECGETGLAMATATISVLDATNSGASCDTVGSGKKYYSSPLKTVRFLLLLPKH